jgi:hypothetical protein
VVEVEDDRDARGRADGYHRRRDRLGPPVEANGVLRELKNDRKAGPLRPADDGLGVLERDDVEGGDRGARQNV